MGYYSYKTPDELFREPQKRGALDDLYYKAPDGTDKHAWVYVPYGCDKNKQYNILYLLHGGGVNEDWWFVTFPDTLKLVDNMIADGLCEPCIIVTPTYYKPNNFNLGPGFDVTERFADELRTCLIPAAETKYPTFARGDVSEQNLIRTRRHRALAGLSMGSMTTYRAGLYHNIDIISWFAPYSGCCGPNGDRDAEVERLCSVIADEYGKNHMIDYLFCCNGDGDIAYAEHKYIMDKAMEKSPFLTRGINCEFMTIPGGVHDMKAWQYDLYETLRFFFTNRRPQPDGMPPMRATPVRSFKRRGGDTIELADTAPQEYTSPCGRGGKVEPISYESRDYLHDGEKVIKPGFIYLPEGCGRDGRKYNVLYLFHGVGGNEREWGMTGDDSIVKHIMDNLIARGEIEPFIVVTPNGRSSAAFADTSFQNMHGFYRFGSELRNDLIPFIEKNYPVNGGDRTKRAAAGLSMGGMQTTNIALCECLDLFSWFGAFSACPTTYRADEIARRLESFDPSLRAYCYYGICGTADGVAMEHASAAVGGLTALTDRIAPEDLVWQEVEGGYHDFRVWYAGFYNFARMIFR